MSKAFETRYHANGDVTIWDVYRQQWCRTDSPEDRVLASLSEEERAKVLSHVTWQTSVTDPAAKFYANNQMQNAPPVPCKFRLGDLVEYINDVGRTFGPYTIVGFTRPEDTEQERCVHLDSAAVWFPVRPYSLQAAEPLVETWRQRLSQLTQGDLPEADS